MNSKIKFLVLPLSLFVTAFVLSGCGEERKNPNETSGTSFQFPHPADWRPMHVSYVFSTLDSSDAENIQKKCAACHPGQKTAFFLGASVSCGATCHSGSSSAANSGNALASVSNKFVVASNACTKCHSPSTHSTSHYPAEAGLCNVCHQAETSHLDGSNTKGVTLLPPEKSCNLCHYKKNNDPVQHGALVAGKQCASCHNAHGSNFPKILKAENADLCTDCHNGSSFHDKVVHAPTKSGKACLSCHEPHSSKNARLLSSEVPTLCTGCHNQSLANGNLVHGNILGEKTSCLTCHGAHSGPNKAMLPTAPTDLCLSCHNKEIKTSGGNYRKLYNIADLIKKSPFTHAPAVYDSCTESCHTPHATPFGKAFKAEYPPVNYVDFKEKPNTYALCFNSNCHVSSLLKPEPSTSDTNFRDDTIVNGKVQRQNLHWFHVVYRGRSCGICHDPHGADQEHNLRSLYKMSSTYNNGEGYYVPISWSTGGRLPLASVLQIIEALKTINASGFAALIGKLETLKNNGELDILLNLALLNEIRASLKTAANPAIYEDLITKTEPLISSATCALSCHASKTYRRLK